MEGGALVEVLVAVGRFLRAEGYRFVTPTPASHARVNARSENAQARDLRGVFGWSRPFDAGLLPAALFDTLERAGCLAPAGPGWRSLVRYSSLDDDLFAHSAYPTTEPDAVFFGPDSYRFARFLHAALRDADGGFRDAVDIGCGSGVGGVVLRRLLGPDCRIALGDVNRRALDFARANAQLAGCADFGFQLSDVLNGIVGDFDLIVSNPPYLNDSGLRAYRHGGGEHGEALSLRILDEGLARLRPGGVLLLYTGVAIVDGIDPLRQSVPGVEHRHNVTISYAEIDPDVFGEELETSLYSRAERIAAIGLVARRTERNARR